MKEDGSLIQQGDLLKNPKLARTFRRIAEDPMTYYNGSLAREIVDDITDYGMRHYGVVANEFICYAVRLHSVCA